MKKQEFFNALHRALPFIFVVGIMLMFAFVASRFFWGTVAGKAVEFASSKGCSDGTAAGRCSALAGKRCVYGAPQEVCSVSQGDARCAVAPASYHLEYDEACASEFARGREWRG